MASNLAFLERYVERESALHAADPRVKFLLAFGFILVTATLPPGAWGALALMIGMVWTAAVASRVGLRTVFLRSLLAVPFVLVAVPTMFTYPAPFLETAIGPLTVRLSEAGTVFFLSLLLKSWASVTAAALLSATTPFPALLDAMLALKVPPTLVAIASLMYRYLFVLVDEVQRMLRAREARSARSSTGHGGSVAWRASVAGGMAGALFVRSFDRGERIYKAMLARGYTGRPRPSHALPPLGAPARAACGAGLSFLALIAIFARVI